MLLEGRNAIVYGGGGAIGGAVARDVTLNVITHGDVQGTPLVDMTAADVEQPVVNGLRTNFLTAQAAARHMIPQGSGVILAFGGYGDPMPDFNLGGLQVGFQAIDALLRQFAAELGPRGIRVVTLQTAGVPESIPTSTPKCATPSPRTPFAAPCSGGQPRSPTSATPQCSPPPTGPAR
jgi:NAD(P)-dependent dehydrogenase (short-subunit alcohol dehydrogenase family)